jgi:hypothetical protein
MSTIDLSRQITDPRKHYAGVRMQQGRVLTDDDFNEAALIDAEELRRTRLHAIGVYGTPDSGFLPANFSVVGGKLDFTLSAGNLYLGGMRLEMTTDEHYLLQKDWLNFDPAVDAQAPPPNGQSRIDLVWIEAWQQPVTAVEDSELFEVALGGPDTTTRWRTMRRVHVTTGVTDTQCADAWSTVSAGFGALGTMAPDMELSTAATLTVTFSQPPLTGDLCSPSQPGGYLGAENQAIRVQMVDAGNYTWGFDDAAPLYRVLVTAKGGNLVKVKLVNPPKDAVHWPLKNQIVEILPWSAALPNGERIADLAGHICKVFVSYNPDEQTFEIDKPLDPAFGTQWQNRSDKPDFFDGTPDQSFYYLRVWNRGSDLLSPPAIPIAATTLGNTGLNITFNGGPLRPADYWIIAARPAAPDVVLPWQLTLPSGAPPNGVKRYRAPIALIKWATSGAAVTGTVISDCRPPFLPLTRIRNCCNVTVGDGTHSFGMFKSVYEAVKSLPASGGTVCVLPGRYVEPVVIKDRHNVTVHGCGPSSRIVAPEKQGAKSTALHVLNCSDIVIENLAFEGGIEAVVEVENSTVVRIASCLIQARDFRDAFSPWPAVFVDGQMIEIEDNIVEVLPGDLERVFHKVAEAVRGLNANAARGGLQLAGGCEDVRIAGNVIVGGTGNGITLGSILRIDQQNPGGRHVPDIDVDDPCAPCDPTDSGTPPRNGDGTVTYESAGDLYNIDIDDNVITRHGANGIAVVRFFSPSDKGELVLVSVHNLRIANNGITQCLRRPVAQSPSKIKLLLGYGGISLAYVTELDIWENLVAYNGRDWLSPVCGVFVLAAAGLRIEHNRIIGNGSRNEESLEAAQQGVRAGVHVWAAWSNPQTLAVKGGMQMLAAVVQPQAQTAVSQLRICANEIEQPLGRALFLLGAGPIAVTDNRLVSEGAGEPGADLIATTVLVADLGVSKEWTSSLFAVLLYVIYFGFYATAAGNYAAKLCALAAKARAAPGLWPKLPTGKLMFNDNQVSFLMRDAPRGYEISSVFLFSLDDVAVNDNQSEYHTDNRYVYAEVVALAFTVRSNDNRLAETWGRAALSLFSAALLNTAADNQSTHCIDAIGLRRAVHDNLTLAEAFCDGACGRQAWRETLLVAGRRTMLGN